MSALRKAALEITVFTSGGVLMTYEIIGSRIVAPFIGTSTYVWTSLIGVILAALSLGYWLGGRLADKRPSIAVLASVLFAAGTLISVTAIIKEVVLSAIASTSASIELRSVIAAVILFAPASICLGLVTPYAVKLRMSDLADTGKTVGRLYALSTVGSIAGTFLAGFVLIPFVGSVRTLYILAIILIALSLVLAPLALSRKSITGVALLIFAIAWTEASPKLVAMGREFHDIDTEYNRVQIFRSEKNGREIRAMSFDPFATQSAIYIDDGKPALDYSRFYHLAEHYNPNFKRVLIIGGAGYSAPRDFLERYPQATIDVVEIDPGMTAIAKQYFNLKDDPRLRTIHEDGRTFLNNAEPGTYDVILMDAFASSSTVPFQLTTVEAVGQIKHLLTPNGVVLLNLISAIEGNRGMFLRSGYATYKTAFPNIDIYKVRPERPNAELQNLILVASSASATDTPNDELNDLLAHKYSGTLLPDLPPLTDDLAPVEYYLSLAQRP